MLHFCVKAIRLVFYLFHHKDVQWLLLTHNGLSVKASVLETMEKHRIVSNAITAKKKFVNVVTSSSRFVNKVANTFKITKLKRFDIYFLSTTADW